MKTTAIIAGIAVLLALLLGCGIGIRGGPLPQTRSTVEIITLDVPVDAPESAWTAALAAWKNGSAEYPLKAATVAGRVDVLTECCAIEVEWLKGNKWHEGLGQAAHYGDATGRQPVLALCSDTELSNDEWEKVLYIAELCARHGIEVRLLLREE